MSKVDNCVKGAIICELWVLAAALLKSYLVMPLKSKEGAAAVTVTSLTDITMYHEQIINALLIPNQMDVIDVKEDFFLNEMLIVLYR